LVFPLLIETTSNNGGEYFEIDIEEQSIVIKVTESENNKSLLLPTATQKIPRGDLLDFEGFAYILTDLYCQFHGGVTNHNIRKVLSDLSIKFLENDGYIIASDPGVTSIATNEWLAKFSNIPLC